MIATVQQAGGIDGALRAGLAPGVFTDARSSEKAEQDVVSYVMERMAASEKFDRPFKQAALNHWELINNILPDDWPYYSRFFEPETQNATTDMIEGLMSGVFAKERPFEIEPVEEQDEIHAEVVRVLMDFALRKLKFKLWTYFQVQECVFFGNGVLKHLVRNSVITKRSARTVYGNPIQPLPIGTEAEVQQRMETWPYCRVVSRFDCYPAPTGESIQAMPYFIERVIMPVEAVKYLGRMAGYRNTDKLDGFMSSDSTNQRASGEWSEQNFDLYQRLAAVGYDVRDGNGEGNSNNAVKYAELLVYTESPVYEDGCVKLAIIGDRQWLLKGLPGEDTNPFWHGKKPYSDIKFQPRNGQVWQAKGVAELIEVQQVKINKLTSQAGDTIEAASKPMTLVEEGVVDDVSDLDPYPGKVVTVQNIERIKWREQPRVSPDVWSDVQLTRTAIQRAGGAIDYGRGIAGSSTGLSRGTETATGIMQLLNAANSAKGFKWRLAEETGISDGLNLILSNTQQVMDRPTRIRILGESRILREAGFERYLTVNPDDVQGEYDIYAVGASSSVDNATQAELLTKIVTGWAQLPKFWPRVKQEDIALEVAELGGIRNPRRFLMSDEEYAAAMEQESQQADAEQMAAMLQLRLKAISNVQYRFAPHDVQAQIEQLAGYQPSPTHTIAQILEQIAMRGAMSQPRQMPQRAMAYGA